MDNNNTEFTPCFVYRFIIPHTEGIILDKFINSIPQNLPVIRETYCTYYVKKEDIENRLSDMYVSLLISGLTDDEMTHCAREARKVFNKEVFAYKVSDNYYIV